MKKIMFSLALGTMVSSASARPVAPIDCITPEEALSKAQEFAAHCILADEQEAVAAPELATATPWDLEGRISGELNQQLGESAALEPIQYSLRSLCSDQTSATCGALVRALDGSMDVLGQFGTNSKEDIAAIFILKAKSTCQPSAIRIDALHRG